MSFTSKKNILGKERERHLKAEYIMVALDCQAKSSMDRNNLELFDFKIKLAALKARKKSLSVYAQL